ncbi:MAG: cobyric acid synthase [Henriciella sp.]|nr:cobyric acid synthase [Henriciella sp.]
MLQGTGSDVGKSVLTAALCRTAKRRGLSVAPFKPQNMSNNAMACADGGEIGRAQALQARAAGLEPNTDMNPVLLKPQSDRAAQIVLQGKALTTMEAADYIAKRDRLMGAVLDSFTRLSETHDLVLVEGAGSPAEVNLRQRDIANMGFARAANVPVCLIGDIDKGGLIASLVGTQNVLSPDDAAMIKGFVVNKFRGDPRLFDDGVTFIEDRTNWPCLGVIPWLHATAKLPAEDAVILDKPSESNSGRLKIAAPMLSRIANFDDADPLKLEPNVDFQWVPPGKPIPRDTDLIILFGTKSTLADLAFLKTQNWHHDIIAHANTGGHVLGICGGYQMLGKRVRDPGGYDGPLGDAEGLGLLDVETIMTNSKRVAQAQAISVETGAAITGYEIHTGETTGNDTCHPFSKIQDREDGARSSNGHIQGTYLHGAFADDTFRNAWLDRLGAKASSDLNYESAIEGALEELADGVEAALDIEALFSLAEKPSVSR